MPAYDVLVTKSTTASAVIRVPEGVASDAESAASAALDMAFDCKGNFAENENFRSRDDFYLGSGVDEDVTVAEGPELFPFTAVIRWSTGLISFETLNAASLEDAEAMAIPQSAAYQGCAEEGAVLLMTFSGHVINRKAGAVNIRPDAALEVLKTLSAAVTKYADNSCDTLEDDMFAANTEAIAFIAGNPPAGDTTAADLADARSLLDEFDRYNVTSAAYVGSPFAQKVQAFLAKTNRN